MRENDGLVFSRSDLPAMESDKVLPARSAMCPFRPSHALAHQYLMAVHSIPFTSGAVSNIPPEPAILLDSGGRSNRVLEVTVHHRGSFDERLAVQSPGYDHTHLLLIPGTSLPTLPVISFSGQENNVDQRAVTTAQWPGAELFLKIKFRSMTTCSTTAPHKVLTALSL